MIDALCSAVRAHWYAHKCSQSACDVELESAALIFYVVYACKAIARANCARSNANSSFFVLACVILDQRVLPRCALLRYSSRVSKCTSSGAAVVVDQKVLLQCSSYIRTCTFSCAASVVDRRSCSYMSACTCMYVYVRIRICSMRVYDYARICAYMLVYVSIGGAARICQHALDLNQSFNDAYTPNTCMSTQRLRSSYCKTECEPQHMMIHKRACALLHAS